MKNEILKVEESHRGLKIYNLEEVKYLPSTFQVLHKLQEVIKQIDTFSSIKILHGKKIPINKEATNDKLGENVCNFYHGQRAHFPDRKNIPINQQEKDEQTNRKMGKGYEPFTEKNYK